MKKIAEYDPKRAFVEGAKWAEFYRTGFTMWQSDVDVAEAEAINRYSEFDKIIFKIRIYFILTIFCVGLFLATVVFTQTSKLFFIPMVAFFIMTLYFSGEFNSTLRKILK